MKILYISYDGMTDPLGQSQVIPYLIGLSKKGHQITIVSCEKNDRFIKYDSYIQTLLNSNNIAWEPVAYSSTFPILSKQINLKKIKDKASTVCIKNKPDIIHCRSYMAALIGLDLKRKYGGKFIFDMRGFWADERIDGKIWDKKNLIHHQIYLFFKKKEIAFLKNADCTISLTHNAKKEILGWDILKMEQPIIEVIPCCVDLELFSNKNIDPKTQEKLKTDLKINPTDFIISYLGSIGTWYMLEEMLDFFKVLITKKTGSKFLFITQDDETAIINLAASKGIPRDKLIIHTATRNEVPIYLSLSDISLYFIKPLFSKKASSPTKTGEIMAMGIPIITNTGIGDSDKIIAESGSGKLIDQFSDAEYNRIIDQIDVLLKVEKLKIREAAEYYFSLEKGIEDYHAIYQKLKP